MIRKIFFGLGCLLLGCRLAYAGPNASESGSKWRTGQRIQEIYSQLNLTDDQKKQLEANKQDRRSKMALARQAMRSDREALRAELMKPQLDAAKVHAIDDQIKTVQDQIEDTRLNAILAVRSTLTTEQFLKFTALMRRLKEGQHDKD